MFFMKSYLQKLFPSKGRISKVLDRQKEVASFSLVENTPSRPLSYPAKSHSSKHKLFVLGKKSPLWSKDYLSCCCCCIVWDRFIWSGHPVEYLAGNSTNLKWAMASNSKAKGSSESCTNRKVCTLSVILPLILKIVPYDLENNRAYFYWILTDIDIKATNMPSSPFYLFGNLIYCNNELAKKLCAFLECQGIKWLRLIVVLVKLSWRPSQN